MTKKADLASVSEYFYEVPENLHVTSLWLDALFMQAEIEKIKTIRKDKSIWIITLTDGGAIVSSAKAVTFVLGPKE
jgi:hypothetical protein